MRSQFTQVAEAGWRNLNVASMRPFAQHTQVLNSTLGREDGNVYEALLIEARRSSMNLKPDGTPNEVPAFVEALRPYVNYDVLQYANRSTPASDGSGTTTHVALAKL